MTRDAGTTGETAVAGGTDGATGSAGRAGTVSRRKVLLSGGLLGTAALSGVGGWQIGQQLSPAPSGAAAAPPGSAAYVHFVTEPDLRPPHLQVADLGVERSTGHVLLTPSLLPGVRGVPSAPGGSQMGLSMTDVRGQLVWFVPTSQLATNLEVQTYRGKPVLTYWTGNIVGGIGYGNGYVLDSTYQKVATIKAGNGLQTDLHELTLTPEGTALITAYRQRAADLSKVGGPKDGSVFESVVQEVDVATGKVRFQWNSLDHVGVDESYTPVSPTPMDYFHVNSVSLWDDHSLLVSGRNTWAVYRIDRRTGAVIWRLGGKRSDFAIGKGANFEWQHHVRRVGPTAMTVFDDAATPAEERQSRGLLLRVDEGGRRVSLTRAYTHPLGLLAFYEGSVQVLPDGHVFVGWGTEPYASEFDAEGNLLLDVRLPTNHQSYRAFRGVWHGLPPTSPRLVVDKDAIGGYAAHVSWNGATDVAHWELVSGSSPRSLTRIGHVPKSGFETAVTLHPVGSHVAVAALDPQGRRLGMSPVVRI